MDDLLESQRNAHLGTWRVDLTTSRVVWSDELYRIFGLEPASSLPPYSKLKMLITEDSWDKFTNSVQTARTSGIPFELELETIGPNHEQGWIWVKGKAITDPIGSIIGLRGSAQDITERKKKRRSFVVP